MSTRNIRKQGNAKAEPTKAQEQPKGESEAIATPGGIPADPADNEKAVTSVNGEPVGGTRREASPADDFRAVFSAALDSRDLATGEMPAVWMDAVRVAFRQLRGQDRAALPLTLQQEANARALADPGNPDVGLMLAAGKLAAVITEAVTAPRQAREAKPRDVVGEYAEQLASLEVALQSLTHEAAAALTAEQFDACTQRRSAILSGAAAVTDFTPSFPAWLRGRKAKAAATGQRGDGRTDVAAEVAAFLATKEAGAVVPYGDVIRAVAASTGIETIGGSVSFMLDNPDRLTKVGAAPAKAVKDTSKGPREIKAVRVVDPAKAAALIAAEAAA